LRGSRRSEAVAATFVRNRPGRVARSCGGGSGCRGEAFVGYLPEAILWRQKEQFSDGVGYGWIDGLKAYAQSQVSDIDFARAQARFPINPPQTKEAYYYRRIFEQHFRTRIAPEQYREGSR